MTSVLPATAQTNDRRRPRRLCRSWETDRNVGSAFSHIRLCAGVKYRCRRISLILCSISGNSVPARVIYHSAAPHRAKPGPKFCVEPGPVQGSHGSAALTPGRRPDAGSKCRKPRGENLGVSFANRLSGGLVGFRPGPPESGHCRASRLSCRCRIGPPRLGPGRWDFAL
jgi:hypothetical protein